jgi:hypothetical protein
MNNTLLVLDYGVAVAAAPFVTLLVVMFIGFAFFRDIRR